MRTGMSSMRKEGQHMARSVSVRTSVKDTSIDHNNRTNPKELKNRGEHIDFSRSKNNLTLIKKPIREVYEEEFHGAVLEYNKRQKRKDRQISTRKGGYYRKVRTDMTLDVQREFIFQVGRKEDEPLSDELLDEMYTVVHHDEGGVPHLHINAVPVAKGYKKGMAKRPSFSKMLKKEGVSFKEFCDNERNELAAVMKEYTGEDRLLVGTHDYLLPQQYRDLMKKGQEDIQNLKDDMINRMNEQNNNTLNDMIRHINEQNNDTRKKLKEYKNNLELANKGIKQKQAEQEKQANELSEQRKELDARSSNLSVWAKKLNKANETLKSNNDIVNNRMAKLSLKSNELDAREANLNAFAKDVKEKNDNANEKLDKVGKKEFDISKRETALNAREASLKGKESEYEQKVLEFRKSIDRQQELNSSLISKLQDLLRRATDRTLAKLNEIKSRTERLKKQNQSDFVTGLEDLNRIADVSEEGTQTEFNKNLKKATDIADLNFIDFSGLDDKQL